MLEDSQNSDIHNNAITSLDWHRKYGLFSSNKEGFIHEWDLRGASLRNKYNVVYDSKNKQASKVSAIKIIPHIQVSVFHILPVLVFTTLLYTQFLELILLTEQF